LPCCAGEVVQHVGVPRRLQVHPRGLGRLARELEVERARSRRTRGPGHALGELGMHVAGRVGLPRGPQPLHERVMGQPARALVHVQEPQRMGLDHCRLHLRGAEEARLEQVVDLEPAAEQGSRRQHPSRVLGQPLEPPLEHLGDGGGRHVGAQPLLVELDLPAGQPAHAALEL
jgi:hypothetical protein